MGGIDDNKNQEEGTIKSGIGKTGVHLRYHKFSKYKKLSEEQQAELRSYRETNGIGKTTDGETKKRKRFRGVESILNKKIKGMIAKMFAVESPNPPDVDEALKQYILSVVNTNSNNPVVQPAVASITTAVIPLITSILRAKLAANK